MPVFTAAATFIASAIGVTSVLGVAAINFGVRVLASAVVSSLISNRAQPPAAGPTGTQSASQTTGSRVMLPASTDNKIGVVYGSAFISPAMIDAKISIDQKTMWYALALCEVTDTGVMTLGNVDSATHSNIFWGDKELVFDASDKTKVIKWVNSNGEEDTKVNGYMNVYMYKNGSFQGANTATTAVDVMSDSQIAAAERWNGPRYATASGSATMAGVSFVIIKLVYNQDAGIVGLDQFKIKVSNSLNRPGEVIQDYLTNKRYGCGIPYSQVDEVSIAALNAYSDQLIDYTNTSGGTSQQPRYRVNGPINTGINCLNNLQYLVDTCDSWLQWNEAVAKWSVIANRSYLDYTTYEKLFVVSETNMTSGVNVSPVDLNSTFNLVESQFPNAKIKDQTDYNFIYLDDADKNPNEPINKLVIQFPQVNNSVQAHYLATRRLIQSREDLVVNFSTDYSGIQIDAGDVIRVRHSVYGWGPYAGNPTNPDKLFRVEQVQESKSEDGNLGVHLSLIEYNNQVYENIDITDYEPAANTGLTDPTIVGKPLPPTIGNINTESGTFTVNCIIPTVGAITSMEFWYGPTPTIEDNNYKLWDTQFNGSTPVYTGGSTESSDVVGFQPSTYFWAVRAVTQSTKSQFSNSTEQPWSPAQPATRKTCDQITSQTVSYTDLYKLWASNTRGSVLTCDYTPADSGSDAGGKATNQIQLDIAINEYTNGLTTGLVAEVWSAVKDYTYGTNAVAYGSNGFIICGTGLIQFTGNMQGANTAHPDTYLTFAVGLGSDSIYGAACNGGTTYVAVGSNGMVVASPTGYDSWSYVNKPAAAANMTFGAVTWNGSLFVAVGGIFGAQGGLMYIMSSTDGFNWTERLNTTGYNNLNTIAWNGSSFLAAGDGFAIATSSNGVSWSPLNVPGGTSYTISGATWAAGNSRWILVGRGPSTSVIFTSTDAATFNIRYSGNAGEILYGVASNFGVYEDSFAVGTGGAIVYSGDGGATWTAQPSNTNANLYVSANLNNAFYIFGSGSVKPLVWPISTSSVNFDFINLWQTARIWAYGSNQNDPYDTTIQAVQDQLPNNIPITATIKTGAYLKDTLTRYLLVAGDLNNPTTPSTMYASRKTIAITEFKG